MAVHLDVYLEAVDAPIGHLTGHDDYSLSFAYAEHGRAISLSLPLREAPYSDADCRGFFQNLLFENEELDRIVEKRRIDRADVARLLSHLGRDCPGAVSCVPRGEAPGKRPGVLTLDYEEYGDEIERIVASLRAHRRMPEDSADPSPLAGVQGKIAVAKLANGMLAAPRNGAPTTHILKVPRQREIRAAEHEALLLDIARRTLSHPVASAEVVDIGGANALLVERYDRRVADGKVRRVHQEDFCQALNLPPSLKYERGAEDAAHAFTARRIGDLLGRFDAPGRARLAIFLSTVLRIAVGDTDNHAKNYSILHDEDGPRFAPVYDVVPVMLDSQVTHEFGFRVGDARFTEGLTPEAIRRFVADFGFRSLSGSLMQDVRALLQALADEIDALQGPARKGVGDMMASQLEYLARAFEIDLKIPERDWFPRPEG